MGAATILLIAAYILALIDAIQSRSLTAVAVLCVVISLLLS